MMWCIEKLMFFIFVAAVSKSSHQASHIIMYMCSMRDGLMGSQCMCYNIYAITVYPLLLLL